MSDKYFYSSYGSETNLKDGECVTSSQLSMYSDCYKNKGSLETSHDWTKNSCKSEEGLHMKFWSLQDDPKSNNILVCHCDSIEKNSKDHKYAKTSKSIENLKFRQLLASLRRLSYKLSISRIFAKPIGVTELENQFDTTLKSLSEKFDNIDDLKLSPIDECLKIIDNVCNNYLSKIIDNLTKQNQLEKYQKSCLNCLHLSINIISKYIENHRPSITVNDSNLMCAFDAFFDIISSNHLAERICEAILYAMCSLMNFERNKCIDKKWKDKLESCFHNKKINETIKLASSVILVQLDISNIELIQEIAQYLFTNINIEYCLEDFGFTQSEINEARKNALKKLFDNCEKLKASSPFEICNAIECDETKLDEIEKCVNEIRNEVNDDKNQRYSI